MPDTPDQTPAPDGTTPPPAGSSEASAQAARELFEMVADATLPVSPPASRPGSSQPRNTVPDLPLPEELTALLPHGMYKVEGFLGQGGMGAVYKGTHVRLKRPVAIKIMHREAGRDYDFAQRFEREAQAMARLSHPNIVGVHDYGEAGPDYLYIVMELVDGADLMDVIRTGRMTQEMALTLLPQICDALQFAHDHSIVHRDIKPSNIMLTRDGRVKMCDFGLAKRYDVESSFRTQTGTGMGTPDYAAPEQFKEGAPIDHRADIYALGVMIYQMITGELPRGVWKPPSQRAPVVPEWDDIVAHAMQSDPADRYQKASEIKTDVSRIRPAESRRSRQTAEVAVPAAPQPRALASTPTKSRAPLLIGVIAILAVLLGLGFLFMKQPGTTPPVEDDVRSPAANDVKSPVTPGGGLVTSSSKGPKQTLDLIALVDVQRDRLKAEGNAGANVWTKSGGQLVFTSGDKRAGKIAAPVALNGLRDYEIEIGVSTAAPDAIGIDLPMSARNQATIAFMPGEVVLLRDGNTSNVFGNWPKEASSPPWKLAARIKFDADGINGTISATVNGTAMGEWRGALTQLRKTTEPHPDFPGQLVPALYIPSGDRTHTSWTLRTFDGEAKVLRGAAATPAPIAAPALPESGWQPLITATTTPPHLPGKREWSDKRLHLLLNAVNTDTPHADGALRARIQFQNGSRAVGLVARSKSTGESYKLNVLDQGSVSLNVIGAKGQRLETLGRHAFPKPLAAGDLVTLELRVQGDRLTGLVNGAAVIEVRDTRYPDAGTWGIVADDGWFETAEVQVLAPSLATVPSSTNLPVSKSSVATATKDAPFINTLGMKFVPVPGTQVLFSIWHTRVQDYAEFAKAQESAGKKVDGSWKMQVKDGVPVGREADHPVVSVSWEEAQAFCAWLTEKETVEGNLTKGAKYRLPTDAEWSVAVGLPPEDGSTPEEKYGKNDVDFPWGKEWPPKGKVGNYADESFHGKFPVKRNPQTNRDENLWMQGYTDGYATTAPVGSFPANAYGLHDMGGNVWQWCEDWFNKSQTSRVLRGASWNHVERDHLLSSLRHHREPIVRYNFAGFRCVLEPEPSTAAAASLTPPARLSASTEPWVDVLPRLAGQEGMVREGAGIKATVEKYVPLRPAVSHGAIRVLCVLADTQKPVTLRARHTNGNGYRFWLSGNPTVNTAGIYDQVTSAEAARRGNAVRPLKKEALPVATRVIAGVPLELEFRLQGSRIIGKLNGNVVCEVEDETYPAGEFQIHLSEGAVLLAAEALTLPSPDLTVPQSSVATATKDAPFINTLGMKFVPVPITGGPTDGQRVLFSVWETRVQDYEVFVKEKRRAWKKPDHPQEPTHPAVMVSWDDAVTFCAWLTEHERSLGKLGFGHVYRLPSDHEWSCAIGIGGMENPAQSPAEKGGKISKLYPWGTDWPPPSGVGNYAGEEMREPLSAKKYPWITGVIPGLRDAFVETSPVGSFEPSKDGLHDLSGNAWEWCADMIDDAHNHRVMRGGSWEQSQSAVLLSSARGQYMPTNPILSFGFRVVLATVRD